MQTRILTLFAVTLLVASLALPACTFEPAPSKKVLIVHSYHED